MAIITRMSKGRSLTFQELDNNFLYLDAKGANGNSDNRVVPINAATLLVAGRLVALIKGNYVPYDAANRAHAGSLFGLALTTGNASQLVQVRREGTALIVGLGLSPDADYFAGAQGQLVQDPAGLAFSQLIGRAASADQLLYAPQDIFIL